MDIRKLEEECDIEFTRTGGPGGQHRNKAETAVRVTHRESGIVVVASDHRSQHQNRIAALERIGKRLEELDRKKAAEEKRKGRRPTSPSRAARERRLSEKQRRGRRKKLRRRIRSDPDD